MSKETSQHRTSDSQDDLALRQALFEGLVYNQAGDRAPVAMIGGVAHYAVPDNGFMRHVEAFRIDNYVIEVLHEQIVTMREQLVETMLQMMGTDDILAKAALEASIKQMSQNIRQSDTSQWVPWLAQYGFRIVVDVHGRVVEIVQPEPPGDWDDE
jgi:hypothetical protein